MKFGVHFLLGLGEYFDELGSKFGIIMREKRVGCACVTSPAGSSNAVHIVLDLGWHVIIDDKTNIIHI